MICLEDVSKIYRTVHGQVRALDGLTLTVEAGQYVAVRGASGSGKSTLLALVGGLAQASSGRIVVAGHEVSSMSAGQRAKFRADHIGFVFQMFHLFPYLNVVDNVRVASPAGRPQASRVHLDELLGKFGLEHRRFHRPAQLSAGERQRVAMARAILNRPQLLLADEPTGNLDEKNAQAVLDWLDQYHAEGGTILLVTHHDNAARRATRSIELREGRMVEPAASSSRS